VNVVHILADTLRRDHCGPWHRGQTVRSLGDPAQPDWVVPTPNIDRLAARGTVFDQAWSGSFPCMPARRDLYTGRFEFPYRGWGPLEDDDDDLPRRISGPPNRALSTMDRHVSYLVTDHFHLWEQGSGNYHMGFTGFEFIRGMEADAWHTDPIDVPIFEDGIRGTYRERHFHNQAILRQGHEPEDESTWFATQTFTHAADWLERNHTWPDFYLHIDSFSPHEPNDPPERLVKLFDPRGYDNGNWRSIAPQGYLDTTGLSDDDLLKIQAFYAASIVHLDENLGRLWDVMDRHHLWDDTLVIFTTDHGTFNGSNRRTGKLQSHLYSSIAQIPLIISHPALGHGERREQVVQLVDCYPTILDALGEDIPDGLDGRSLLPMLGDPDAPGHDIAICGTFGQGMTASDGAWALHVIPKPGNEPLYWYSHHLAIKGNMTLGPYECLPGDTGRRQAGITPFPDAATVWLSNLGQDPYECHNVIDEHPDEARRLADALRRRLVEIGSPPEQLERLDFSFVHASTA
jgi:arylsulfatase A-like enzyme